MTESETLFDLDEESERAEKKADERRSDRERTELSPTQPSEIRWFFRFKDRWYSMRGKDSLLLEVRLRVEQKMPLSEIEQFPSKEEVMRRCQKGPVSVLNGYYTPAFFERKLKPIFWKGHAFEVVRGTWFFEYDWQPVDEKLAERIEREHAAVYAAERKKHSDSAKKSTAAYIHALDLNGCRIEWISLDNLRYYSTSSFLQRRLSRGMRLRRGFRRPARYQYGPKPVDHVIFVVHGMGAKMVHKDIVAKTKLLRRCAEQFLRDKFRHISTRPLFIPVEWRLGLHLDEQDIDAITLPNWNFLRQALNDTVLDLFFYNSDKYHAEVINGVSRRFNQLYRLFINHNADFERSGGKFSIVAHSLGSVISCDIIAKWSPLLLYNRIVAESLTNISTSLHVPKGTRQRLLEMRDLMTVFERERAGGLMAFFESQYADLIELNFKIQNLFAVGSPLSIYFALRGDIGPDVFPPKDSPRLYNILFPRDVAAFRVEPLIDPSYSRVKMVLIPPYTSNYDKSNKLDEREVEYAMNEALENIDPAVKSPPSPSSSNPPLMGPENRCNNSI